MKKFMRSTWQKAMNLPLPLPLGEVSAKLTEREYTPSGTACHLPPRGRKAAFNLAEVMITLAIIGVVAVITMSVLLREVSMRVNSNRQANIVQKVTKAVETMVVNGDYENITNTEQFVDKLSKYLKILKRCDANNIDKCWPTKKVKTPSGGTYEVKNAKKGTDIHVNSSEDNVGLVLADGASLILSFNPEASAPSAEGGFTSTTKNLPIGKNKYKEFAYTSNATGAIDFVMDVNGGTGPNQEPSNDGEYYDIRPFKIALFSKPDCLGFKVNGICVVDLGTNYNYLNCNDDSNSKYCKLTSSTAPTSTDYWAGANKACADLGMKLPDRNTGTNIVKTSDGLLSFSYFSSGQHNVGDFGGYVTIIDGQEQPFGYHRTNKYKAFCIE